MADVEGKVEGVEFDNFDPIVVSHLAVRDRGGYDPSIYKPMVQWVGVMTHG